MLLLLLLLLLLEPGPRSSAASRRSHVHRRGILELAGTVNCVGARNPLAYVDYGCYCGLGGRGKPKDATDWCCFHHDCCYTRAEEAGCRPKLNPYPWRCISKRVVCGSSGRDLEKGGRVMQDQQRTNAKNFCASVTRRLLTALLKLSTT
ncbi:PREDICTED: group 10 secretory phospholipase A2 isoform X2 [Galeopterus variegatus]|uniref:Phospholipase A2 n=1 Tax=Galeopterus variegatus TaxID=482537 RepID=A0ABM0RCM1_GALVR|nr:PREDICTED: group 10 secretory phospholipase A2 isoform X2 [Galeopterus variegatus]